MAKRIVLFLCWLLCLGFVLPSEATLTVQVTKSVSSALPIAIPSFGAGIPGQPSVAEVVRSDLSHSGLFNVLSPASYPGDPQTPSAVQANAWTGIGATGLAIGSVQRAGQGYVVTVYVYNVATGKELAAKRFSCSPAELHMTAHHVADVIYQAF
ncbi:MAG: Tol-Pal system beta propeller repeat protein TolB, partial [Acidithiobacillus sp.]|nr:Tol-Pal system beta propeller repeat protein TolB [Acidithiobacillus sp.]